MHTKTKFLMASFLIVSALLPTTFASAAGVNGKILFSDGFESGNTKNWTSNTGWNVVDNDASEMQSRAYSKGNSSADTDTLTKKISTSGYENVRIAFDYKTTDFEPNDSVKLQAFYDGRWHTLKTYTDGREALGWSHTSISVSASDRSNFAFRFVSKLDSEADEFSIDKVQLIGTPVHDEKTSHIQSITAHIYRTHTSVEIDYDDGSRWLQFGHITDRHEIAEETAFALGLTESQVFTFFTFVEE